jgi:hypothetical protein
MNHRFYTLKLSGLLLAAGLVCAPAMAQLSVGSLIGVVEATANASVTILSPLSITPTGLGMNFGNVVSSSTLGTVVLTSSGDRTVTGGAGTMGQAGSVSAATFDVTGQKDATYSIALPLLATLNQESGTLGVAMTVTAFTSSLTASALPLVWNGVMGTAGTGTFNVGGTLNVGMNQAAGLYTGTFPVLLAYN